MAERRYSQNDQQRRNRDIIENLNAKGVIQGRDVTPLHPGGETEALRSLQQNQSFVKDQSQSQIAQGKIELEKRKQESKESMERAKERKRKG